MVKTEPDTLPALFEVSALRVFGGLVVWPSRMNQDFIRHEFIHVRR